MLVCQNAERVHGQRKVGNPCSKHCLTVTTLFSVLTDRDRPLQSNDILHTSRRPDCAQEALYCESGWSVSVWNFPSQLLLSLDN